MGLCFASFLGIFAFVFGIAFMAMIPGSISIVIEQIIPLPMGIMAAGFVVSLIAILAIRSMGDLFSDVENKTLSAVFTSLCKSALIISLALCAVQVYFRLTYNEWGFFVTGDNVKAAFQNASFEDKNFTILFVSGVATVFLGFPLYVIAYFNGDFSQYVTVTRTHLSDGTSYESGRSEAYVTVGQFIIMGLLFTVPFVTLSFSMLCYLFPAAFAALLSVKKGKKALIATLIVFGVIAVGLTIFSVLPAFGIVY